MSENYYFDYAATAPVRPEAMAAVVSALTQFGNPSSGYPIGRQTAFQVSENRKIVAQAMGCSPSEVFFVSCGTEGDNWAVRKAAEANCRRGRHIITTAIEHAAVLETCREMEKNGYDVTVLKPDSAGRISPEDLKAALREDTILVSMMLVNNETGRILPVQECVQMVKAFNSAILFHCDAVQGFLKVPYPMASLGADLVTVSGHKIGAPKGIGALYIRKGVRIAPLLTGGGQESGMRSGTEASAQIAGFAAACSAMMEDQTRLERTAAIKKSTLLLLKEQIPKLEIISEGDVPHICAVTLPGYKGEVIVRVLGDRGVCISSGSACHKGRPSHVFAAMELPRAWKDGALRISFSPDVTEEEQKMLVLSLKEASESLFPTMS